MSGSGFKVESGMQLLSRLSKKDDPKLFYPSLFSTVPKFGDIIEISSDDGISSLLIDIICEVLMPFELGGTGLGVLVLSTDGNLNIENIFKVLHLKLSTCCTDNLNEISQKCLKNLELLEIYDTTQFHTAIQNLEFIISNHHNIGLIVINSLTAFYWSEQGFKISKMNFYMQNLLQKIHNVIKHYKLIILYTRPDSFSSKDFFNNGEKFDVKVLTHKSNYEVNIASKKFIMKKNFVIINGIIKWL